jgi:hypothetical protein
VRDVAHAVDHHPDLFLKARAGDPGSVRGGHFGDSMAFVWRDPESGDVCAEADAESMAEAVRGQGPPCLMTLGDTYNARGGRRGEIPWKVERFELARFRRSGKYRGGLESGGTTA